MQLAAQPNSASILLALDTSTERLAVAVQGADGQRWQLVAEGGALASANLLPQVAKLLAQAGLAYADLQAIAFGRGPGAFTGLRTACAVAQGIALGLDKPVLPIDSLLIVAEDARLQHFAGLAQVDVAVAMDARMDEVYAAVYRYAGGAWQVLQPSGLYSLPALTAAWSALNVQAVAGSALHAFGERLPLPADPLLLRVAQEHDRAAALLGLAAQAAQAGQGVDAALALPLYLRDKVAQTTAERDAIKAEKAQAAAIEIAGAVR